MNGNGEHDVVKDGAVAGPSIGEDFNPGGLNLEPEKGTDTEAPEEQVRGIDAPVLKPAPPTLGHGLTVVPTASPSQPEPDPREQVEGKTLEQLEERPGLATRLFHRARDQDRER